MVRGSPEERGFLLRILLCQPVGQCIKLSLAEKTPEGFNMNSSVRSTWLVRGMKDPNPGGVEHE